MDSKIILIVALFSLAVAAPVAQHSNENSGSFEDSKYSFEWGVKDESSENYYGQKESRNDDGRVEGFYYVRLPDTRLMKVTYYVDGNSGFVADVSYEGSAEFDVRKFNQFDNDSKEDRFDDNSSGQFDNNSDQFDNNSDQFDNNSDQFDNNSGQSFERNQFQSNNRRRGQIGNRNRFN